MAHSKSKNYIHLIFSTKDREPLISPAVESFVYGELTHQLISLNCPVDTLNGMPDHIHILFLLHPQKSLSEVVKQIKGSSSHSINQRDLLPVKFAWGIGYAAFSVSESAVPAVRQYIQNQKTHHQKRTFESEYQEFLTLHGLNDDVENG